MIITNAKGAKYVCDYCGKKIFVEQIHKEIKEEPCSFVVATPWLKGWIRNEDGTLACEECAEK